MPSQAERQRALLEQAERVGGIGSWEWNLADGEVLWSDNLFRIHGFEPGEVVPTVELAVEMAHPDDRERVAAAVAENQEAGAMPPTAYRIVRGDGTVRHLVATLASTEEGKGGPRRMVGSIQDVTERWRAEREIAAHLAVAEVLADWTDLDASGPRLLCQFATAMDLDVGFLWVTGDRLRLRCSWISGKTDASALVDATAELELAPGTGLPGQAWARLEPIAFGRVEDLQNARRRAAAVGAGLCSAFAFPASYGGEALAVLEFFAREQIELTDRLRRSLAAMGTELGEFLSRHRADLENRNLTPRELEVLQLAAVGLSGPQIAERLVLGAATIKTHFQNIYEKLGVTDRAGAVGEGMRIGLIK